MKSHFKLICIICFIIFSCQPKEQKTEFSTLLETTSGWNGDALPEYPKGQPKITILKVIIPPYSKLDVQNDLATIWPTLLKILKWAKNVDDFLVNFSMNLA